ncbi:hypothetical protein PLESTB_001911000 [Pleodorina starrii]|uniref:Manganese transport regulator n=1 Tax=Pleodorina starrii TaxID=330485 RepID=A0A9W6C330_9CHLO|nr:hypothetical protein PLESTB_001911000 [Pleodorina starrii]
MDLSEITPVAQDYLKAIWSATEWGDPPITTTALAARMGTSAPNVTDTVKRLAGQGLVEYQPYKPVTLTPQGRAYAVAMVRRHRLLETFLATTLGYPWEEVHDEAERLEHAASDAMIERIDARLGRPTGRTRRPLNTTRLTEAKPGRYEIIRLSDADPHRLTRFRDCGLVPGGAFRVIAQEASGTTGVPGYHHTAIELAPTEAEAIWVTPTLKTHRSL